MNEEQSILHFYICFYLDSPSLKERDFRMINKEINLIRI